MNAGTSSHPTSILGFPEPPSKRRAKKGLLPFHSGHTEHLSTEERRKSQHLAVGVARLAYSLSSSSSSSPRLALIKMRSGDASAECR